ncbi:ATP-dependent DNA helicase hus2/rqh1, partial [Favolaschia claudopus]
IPSYIHRVVHQKLAFASNATSIRVSINRPNIIYATHVLIDGRYNLRNLDCIIPPSFHPPMRLPNLLILHGDKAETSTFAEYNNSRLPPAFHSLRICRHYHSDMSPEYLEETYNSFADPDGDVLILHATSGCGEGADIKGIEGVVIYGLTEKVPMRFQWEGRGGRSTNNDAFAVTMLEPWVNEMDLTTAVYDPDDPDRPVLPDGLKKKTPTKKERVGMASVQLARCETCKREAYAKFFEDDSPEALEFTCRWCCDGHPDNGFSLAKLFLGPIYTGEVREPAKRKRNKYRDVKDRDPLVDLLTTTTWLLNTHSSHELRFVRPPSFILDAPALKTLSMADPALISSPKSIVSLLKQSEEWEGMWAQSLFDIISEYDRRHARE